MSTTCTHGRIGGLCDLCPTEDSFLMRRVIERRPIRREDVVKLNARQREIASVLLLARIVELLELRDDPAVVR